MRIYVDADACPVIPIVEQVAEKNNIAVTLLCDTNHVLDSDYSEVKIIGAGADAVDFALINLCKKNDIVVTQDYGVAAMALGKGGKNHLKGPKKRTGEDDVRFQRSFEKLVMTINKTKDSIVENKQNV